VLGLISVLIGCSETRTVSARLVLNTTVHTGTGELEFSSVESSCAVNRPTHLYAGQGLKSKGSPYSITERRIPQLILVLGSQPASDVSHKPGGRLPLLSARPAVTAATLKRAATNFTAW